MKCVVSRWEKLSSVAKTDTTHQEKKNTLIDIKQTGKATIYKNIDTQFLFPFKKVILSALLLGLSWQWFVMIMESSQIFFFVVAPPTSNNVLQ